MPLSNNYFPIYQAFDQHLNLVLGEVEECITSKEVDEETEEEIVKVSRKNPTLYLAVCFSCLQRCLLVCMFY